jgi:hypothetical protein
VDGATQAPLTSMTYFILFNTIHDVLKAEKALKERSVEGEVVPLPRSLSSDCGVCIKSDAGADVLMSLFCGMKGVRCFVFDGVDYKSGTFPK